MKTDLTVWRNPSHPDRTDSVGRVIGGLLYTQQESDIVEAETRLALIKSLSATIIWMLDEPTLLQAGRLKATYRLSLADTIVASIALQQAAILLHKDPEFDAL